VYIYIYIYIPIVQYLYQYHRAQRDKGDIIHKEENKTTTKLKVSILHNRSTANQNMNSI